MSLTTSSSEIVIALNRKLAFLDPTTKKITKHHELDPNITAPIDSHPEGPEASENPPTTNTSQPDSIKKIQHIRVSPNNQLLAVTTTGRKMLLLYQIVPDSSLQLLSSRRICRATSALTFSDDSTKLLLCDKTGDCYLFDCTNPTAPGKWILGHLSMVLDVRFTPEMDAIITSDRDEKIRITNYPQTHEIACYCLGHLEYVSCIEFSPLNSKEELISLSGDKTCCVWNYRTGKKLLKLSIPAPGIKLAVRLIDEMICHLAVLLFQPDESVFIYQLNRNESRLESKLLSTHSFPGQIGIDLQYHGSDLYLTTSTEGRLKLQALNYANGKYKSHENEPVNEIFSNEEVTDLEDISGWFKKKFDNVSEYLERKKRRIQEKSAKSQSIECK